MKKLFSHLLSEKLITLSDLRDNDLEEMLSLISGDPYDDESEEYYTEELESSSYGSKI